VVTDTDKLDNIIAQEEQLLKVGVAKAMKAWQEDNSTENMRRWQAAKKALEEFQNKQQQRFKTETEALQYLKAQGWRLEKSKFNTDVNARRVPRVDGYFHAKDLDYYAKAANLPRLTTDADDDTGSVRDELLREQLRKLRLENEIKAGKYILASEEEARDAQLWAFIKADIENHAPALVNDVVSAVLTGFDFSEEAKQHITGQIPQLLAGYHDFVAEMFDRHAKNRAIGAPQP
jgi:hypothetical protein